MNKNLAPLMSSVNMDYITPPDIGARVRRVGCPKGSNRRILDPGTNAEAIAAGIIRAHLTADGTEGSDGLAMAWSVADFWFCNPPYGNALKVWAPKMAYEGRTVGVPGIGLVPGRGDPKWMQGHIKRTADAWVDLRGRQTFWRPIPIYECDATEPPPAKDDKPAKGKYYLRRWKDYARATADRLPPPFRKISDRVAVGPELDKHGKPQAAPFPSLVPFWADPECYEPSAEDELAALRELVRTAKHPVDAHLIREHEEGRQGGSRAHALEQWASEAERLLGSKRFADDLPLRLELFERLAMAGAKKPEHPIDVRTFAAHFGPLGTLTVARGRHRGVYHPRSA